MSTIKAFNGKYGFLSNFYPSPILINGKNYDTVEHFFQASKTADENESEPIRKATTPAMAKKLGRQCSLRRDWSSIKDKIMLVGLTSKFNTPKLKDKLLATGSSILEEGNDWNDIYWGKDLRTGKGLNRLGYLLMKLRKELRDALSSTFQD